MRGLNEGSREQKKEAKRKYGETLRSLPSLKRKEAWSSF